MEKLYLDDLNNDQIFELIPKVHDYFIIPYYSPSSGISDYISLEINDNLKLNNVRVDYMSCDLHVDITQLRSIINSGRNSQLVFYQFEKKTPESLVIFRLSHNKNKTKILKKNGLRNIFSIQWRTFSIESDDEVYMRYIKNDSNLANHITDAPMY